MGLWRESNTKCYKFITAQCWTNLKYLIVKRNVFTADWEYFAVVKSSRLFSRDVMDFQFLIRIYIFSNISISNIGKYISESMENHGYNVLSDSSRYGFDIISSYNLFLYFFYLHCYCCTLLSVIYNLYYKSIYCKTFQPLKIHFHNFSYLI